MKKIIIVFILAIFSISLIGCNKSASFSEDQLVIEINSKTFKLDTSVSPLLEELGDNYEYFEAPSCVYEGTDKIFEYKNISIYTYPLDGKDLIDEIILTSDTYSTKEGIKVGDKISKVKEIYGENYKNTGNMLRYSTDVENLNAPSLIFTYDKDNNVKNINYYSASNIME